MPIEKGCLASWNDKTVLVTARLVPRYLWQSASIDVSLDGHTILKTGGVFKIVGTHIETVDLRGKQHTAEVTWGKGSLRSFPFSLKLDGAQIIESRVQIQNWWLSLWPIALLLCVVAVSISAW